MSSTVHHFINDIPLLYFFTLTLTPPKRLRALVFDDNGDTHIDSPQIHNLSPPPDSEDEGEALQPHPLGFSPPGGPG